jgi:L-ascorbate metabolism protein UlaG (beta-lactamase superfamily)
MRKSACLAVFTASLGLFGTGPDAHAADPAKSPEVAPVAANPAAVPGAPTVVPIAPPAAPTGGTRPGGTTVTWWGHAAFVIVTPKGAVIAIDPWLDNPSAPKPATPPAVLDAILVTHGHVDHTSGVAELAKKTGANVIAAYELAPLIGAEHSSGMTPGGSIKIKDATIHVVEAVHGSGYNADPKNVRYGGPPVGFVIAIDKGPTIYHAGDTDVFSSMALIAERYKPGIALLPIGGYFTMDPAGAALATKLLKVRTVIPMHYGTFPLLAGTPAQLHLELRRQHGFARVLEMKPGDTAKF